MRCIAKKLPISPIKLNLVAAIVRGLTFAEAMKKVSFVRKKAALYVMEALKSAFANSGLDDGSSVVVAEASVGMSMVLKRIDFRARGRTALIRKPYSQIRIVLEAVHSGVSHG